MILDLLYHDVQSAEHGNQIFALVRNEATATKLFDLQKQAQNVRILQADIVDVKALKVRLLLYKKYLPQVSCLTRTLPEKSQRPRQGHWTI